MTKKIEEMRVRTGVDGNVSLCHLALFFYAACEPFDSLANKESLWRAIIAYLEGDTEQASNILVLASLKHKTAVEFKEDQVKITTPRADTQIVVWRSVPYGWGLVVRFVKPSRRRADKILLAAPALRINPQIGRPVVEGDRLLRWAMTEAGEN